MLIFLCEDNKQYMHELVHLLKEVSVEKNWNFQISGYTDGKMLFDEIIKRKNKKEPLPEVVISDVEMPRMDGIELGKALKKELNDCIFVLQTSFMEYAIEGYETGAFRYLLKPVQKNDVLKIFAEIYERKSREKMVVFKTSEEEICAKIADILYIDAEDKYLMVHTVDDNYLIRGSLGDLEEELSEFGFYRIHRKYLVNMWHHKSIRNDKLIMANNDVLPLSRRKEKDYRSAFMRFMEERGR